MDFLFTWKPQTGVPDWARQVTSRKFVGLGRDLTFVPRAYINTTILLGEFLPHFQFPINSVVFTIIMVQYQCFSNGFSYMSFEAFKKDTNKDEFYFCNRNYRAEKREGDVAMKEEIT